MRWDGVRFRSVSLGNQNPQYAEGWQAQRRSLVNLQRNKPSLGGRALTTSFPYTQWGDLFVGFRLMSLGDLTSDSNCFCWSVVAIYLSTYYQFEKQSIWCVYGLYTYPLLGCIKVCAGGSRWHATSCPLNVGPASNRVATRKRRYRPNQEHCALLSLFFSSPTCPACQFNQLSRQIRHYSVW